jgi:hypothetical protein
VICFLQLGCVIEFDNSLRGLESISCDSAGFAACSFEFDADSVALAFDDWIGVSCNLIEFDGWTKELAGDPGEFEAEATEYASKAAGFDVNRTAARCSCLGFRDGPCGTATGFLQG